MSNVPTLTPDGLLSKDARGLDSALIPTGGYRSAHAPALLELPGGDLLCAWFAGSFEGNADIAVGNAVGSVTANTGLIMCLSLVCMECHMT